MPTERSAASARERARPVSRVPWKPPTIAFSVTVISGNGLTIWNVRPMPALQVRSGRKPAMSRPSKTMRPLVGAKTPAMRLKSVVLPAPFGPMSATISPWSTRSDTSETAFRPRKYLQAPMISSIAGIRLVPLPALEAETPCDPRPHAIGHEHDRDAEHDAVEHLLDAGHVDAEGAERGVQRFREQHQDRGAENRAEQRADAADDGHEDDLDRA